ncbi:MAG TPA: hypothetical protein VLX29_10570 [Nitrospirota bacterium]|nr:hypothetical protein [Nitrospirota bacterium]
MKRIFSIMILIFSMVVLLTACGGSGSNGSNGTNGTNGTNGLSALISVVSEPSGTNCPYGGYKLNVGLDTNNNGVLDPSEITSSDYICNGTNGLPSLVSVVSEPSGTNCSYGGYKLNVGLDTNKNGILDPSEITSSEYICNGANGTNSTNGFNSLVSIVSEPSGSNCMYGGLKVSSGLDNGNNGGIANDGILQPGEVTSTTYVCSSAGINWVDVTTTSVQAVPNTGYMADSTAQVTITLPASTSLKKGDIIEVSGVGTGGWKIAQNAGQSIVGDIESIPFVWIHVCGHFPARWTPVGSSSDVTGPVAVILGGGIYTFFPPWIQSTTPGTTGSISGGQYSAVELQYIGNDKFMILSHEGDLIVR